MKTTKRLWALLLVAVMMAVCVAPALAANPYTEVSAVPISFSTLGLTEKLTVTEEDTKNPLATYTLTLGTVQVYTKDGVTYGDTSSITGSIDNQTLGTVSFAAGIMTGGEDYSTSYATIDADAINGGKTFLTKEYVDNAEFVAALKALKFNEPGIYYWEITKTTQSGAASDLTNYNHTSSANTGTALVIRVDDSNGVLTTTVGINEMTNDTPKKVAENAKITNYEDEYPAKPVSLTIAKTVTGKQGAKDQYFKFVVNFTGLSDMAGATLNLDVTNGNAVASVAANDVKYGEEITVGTTTNVQTITVMADGTASATFWLKDGESVKIENILTGAGYTITESFNTGYTVTAAATGDSKTGDSATGEGTDIALSDTYVWTDTYLKEATTVTYTNNKNTAVPTGVLLAAGPALAALAIAGAGIAVVTAGKRRREDEE